MVRRLIWDEAEVPHLQFLFSKQMGDPKADVTSLLAKEDHWYHLLAIFRPPGYEGDFYFSSGVKLREKSPGQRREEAQKALQEKEAAAAQKKEEALKAQQEQEAAARLKK